MSDVEKNRRLPSQTESGRDFWPEIETEPGSQLGGGRTHPKLLFMSRSHLKCQTRDFLNLSVFEGFSLLAPSGALVFIMVYYKPLFQIFQILQIRK